jgi:hypothetical protein
MNILNYKLDTTNELLTSRIGLITLNFNRGHGGLRKEIKVRTPYEALEYWYNLKPDLFIRKPDMFRSVVFESRECFDTLSP